MTSFKDNRVSIPSKRFRFGLSDARECHSYLQGKAFVSIVLDNNIWLTVIEWLGIDLTGTDSVNAPLFGHIYILFGIPTFLG